MPDVGPGFESCKNLPLLQKQWINLLLRKRKTNISHYRWTQCCYIIIIIIIIIIISLCVSSSHWRYLVVSYLNLVVRKFLQVSRTSLSTLDNLNNALVLIVSIPLFRLLTLPVLFSTLYGPFQVTRHHRYHGESHVPQISRFSGEV